MVSLKIKNEDHWLIIVVLLEAEWEYSFQQSDYIQSSDERWYHTSKNRGNPDPIINVILLLEIICL